jgi:hypothetical protein
MTDTPHPRRSPLDHGRDEPDLSDEALDEVCEQLRYHNVRGKYGSVADTIAALRAQLTREREAGERLAEALKPFADAVYNDNGDVTLDTSHIRRQDWLRARAAKGADNG